jgi:hypothetical protein
LSDFEDISGIKSDYDDEEIEVTTHNTSDENRIFHTYDKWECAKAGFYETKPPKGMKSDDCKSAYAAFLSDAARFEIGLIRVISEWKNSCEHYLTNNSMNRIAWLGQAAMCIETGVPSEFRGGFSLMTKEQQEEANLLALKYLNKWMVKNNRPELQLEEAMTDRQSDIY